MNKAMPVTIIGGYLGSGKTTLVNHLLRHADGVRLAVLVNDFGELAIDADLIEAQDGDVISLSGGCVCCSYGDDLSLSLQRLQSQKELPDHILIEASGVALPGAIGMSLSLLRAYQLEGIVVLADSTSIQSSTSEKYIGDTIQRQLNDADLIVLNKLDLLNVSDIVSVQQWLEEQFPQTPFLNSTFSTISPQVFFDVERERSLIADVPGSLKQEFQPHGVQSLCPTEHDVHSVFSSIKLQITEAVDADALAESLASVHCDLVRAKGFVLDHDNTLKTIQVVGRRWMVGTAPESVKTGLVCISCSSELSEAGIRSMCNLES